MGTEAQKLITVSLEKIANFRRRRREMSLHKNLLVTTVIHKARIAIMEETYYMYAAAAAAASSSSEGSGGDAGYTSPGSYVPATTAAEYGAPPPPTYGCPQSVALTGDPLRATEDANMEWEGARTAAAAPEEGPARCECDGQEQAGEDEDDDEEDKENVTPGPRRTRGHKRNDPNEETSPLKRGEDECSPQKRCKWEQDRADEELQLLEGDDDTSHALRLVSVLVTGAVEAGSTSSALRLVRSFSNPDLLLCSKQASKESCKDMRSMMDSCCANRAPMAIAV